MWTGKNLPLSLLFAFVTSSSAVPVSHEYNYAPSHEYAPKDYSFSYGVKDLHTRDVKHQWEKKEGESVRGHYSVLEPDGSVRVVDYTVDDKTGFNAVVKRKGPSYHPVSPGAISHSEFELKPSTTKADQPDYSLLKEIHDSKSSVTQADKFQNYKDDNYEYQQAQEEKAPQDYKYQQPQEEEEGTPEYKYVYVPQEEKDTQEYKYVYAPQKESSEYEGPSSYETSNYGQSDYEAEGSVNSKRYAKENSKVTKLPIDLSLLKPQSKEELIPLDVSLLNPVEIDLSSDTYIKANNVQRAPNKNVNKDVSTKPINKPESDSYNVDLKYLRDPANQHANQLAEAEYEKFLKEYYKTQSFKFSEPYVETDFKPIKTESKTQTTVSNTYKTNKRPVTTPGLRHFSSAELNYAQHNRAPKEDYHIHYGIQKGVGPVQFSNKRGNIGLHKTNSRLRRYGRYTRRPTTRINK